MTDIKIFQVPAELKGVSTLSDGGVSLRFHTNEIKPNEMSELMGFAGKFGWMQFSDSAIHSVPKESPHREAGAKTPSQRLRSSLFVLWQERYSDQLFDPWYEQQMEKIINKVKEQLPPK